MNAWMGDVRVTGAALRLRLCSTLSPHTNELIEFLLMHFGFFRLFATGAEGIEPGADQENHGRKGGNAD